jgi:hypothetical protein
MAIDVPTFGLPLWLQDDTGDMTDTVFSEFYDRVTLSLHQSINRPDHSAIVLALNRHNLAAVMDFGPKHSLGNITFPPASAIPMDDFLRPTRKAGSSLSRHFAASDGQQYFWDYRQDRTEWICTNKQGYIIASYSITDLEDGSPSAASLYVTETSCHLVVELIASLTVMRHIAHYKL